LGLQLLACAGRRWPVSPAGLPSPPLHPSPPFPPVREAPTTPLSLLGTFSHCAVVLVEERHPPAFRFSKFGYGPQRATASLFSFQSFRSRQTLSVQVHPAADWHFSLPFTTGEAYKSQKVFDERSNPVGHHLDFLLKANLVFCDSTDFGWCTRFQSTLSPTTVASPSAVAGLCALHCRLLALKSCALSNRPARETRIPEDENT